MAYTLYSPTGSPLSNYSTPAPALSIQDIFRPSLSSLSAFYSDILTYSWTSSVPMDEYQRVAVFLGACKSAGAQNCTICCLDTSMMFGGLETFHNCLMYPAVAHSNALGILSDTHLAHSLGIDSRSQGNQVAQNITTNIINCLFEYCGNNSQCKTAHQLIFGRSGTPPLTFDFGICDYVAPFSFLNTDVAGVGVYISYWIQSGLALFGTILLLLWSSGTYYLCFPILAIRYGKEAKRLARKLANKWKSKRLPSLTKAMMDFQKAQCFFIMAINVAALVNKYQGGLDPNNLQQLYNNYILIKTISISGYLPITFTLLGLHVVQAGTWYLLVLSILTVGVSIATLVDLGDFSPSPSDLSAISSVAHGIGGSSKCGGNNLTVYCLKTIDHGELGDWDPSNGAYAILGFCIIVLISLVADQSHASINPSTKETKPWFLKAYENSMVDLFSLRGFEFILVLASIALTRPFLTYSSFGFRFLLFYTMAYLLYIFVSSHLGHGRTQKTLGKLKNDWFLFAADFITAIMWFLNFLPWLLPRHPDVDKIGILVWILFTASTVRSMNQIRANNRKTREMTFVCQRSWFGRSSASTPLTLGKSSWPMSWINPAVIMKKSITLTRRHIDEWANIAKTQDWAGVGRKLIIFPMYLAFVALYVIWFAVFFYDLAWFFNLVDKGSWGFGQIVAITIWAGPLCEYLHLEMREQPSFSYFTHFLRAEPHVVSTNQLTWRSSRALESRFGDGHI